VTLPFDNLVHAGGRHGEVLEDSSGVRVLHQLTTVNLLQLISVVGIPRAVREEFTGLHITLLLRSGKVIVRSVQVEPGVFLQAVGTVLVQVVMGQHGVELVIELDPHLLPEPEAIELPVLVDHRNTLGRHPVKKLLLGPRGECWGLTYGNDPGGLGLGKIHSNAVDIRVGVVMVQSRGFQVAGELLFLGKLGLEFLEVSPIHDPNSNVGFTLIQVAIHYVFESAQSPFVLRHLSGVSSDVSRREAGDVGDPIPLDDLPHGRAQGGLFTDRFYRSGPYHQNELGLLALDLSLQVSRAGPNLRGLGLSTVGGLALDDPSVIEVRNPD